ncbi:glycosyltransferase family 2 protein [Microlunatus aurantiacus]|uniref:Glycosyltransferase family 2 protein n=1 Tax=Microlunatus aurantiacus TaxID=446786 RepID=A0ABP7DNA4_9ACTN
MQSKPDVSIVIVNWNTRQYLLDCIASLLENTERASIEIIVVDNASSDGSQDALLEVYPKVRLIQNTENLGFAKANNIGFAAARGAAYCLVNTDVIALDGVIDRLWDYLVTHPGVGMVGPRTIDRDLKTRRNCRRFPTIGNACGDYLWLRRLPLLRLEGRALGIETYADTHHAEVLSGCFMMVRREAVEEVGLLDEGFFFYGEDTDWCKRFSDKGWDRIYHPAAKAIHFGGGSSAAYPVRYYLTMEKADLRYWKKHHPPRHVALYMVIKLIHHVVSVAGWGALWLGRQPGASLKVRGHAINTIWLMTGRSLA